MSSRKKLENITSKDIKRFTLNGQEGQVKVVSIHDGDTCDVVFEPDGRYKERFNCRLLDCNAPELKQKPKGDLARDYLAHLVLDDEPGDDSFLDPNNIWAKEYIQKELDKNKNLLYATFGKFDSFGRALVTLKENASDQESINDMMKEFVKKLKKLKNLKKPKNLKKRVRQK